MKKVRCAAAVIAAGLLAVVITGCSGKCKESGCDEKATQDGYCDYHYAYHVGYEIGSALGELFS